MKYNIFFIVVLFAISIAWIKVNDEKFPPPPENITKISKTVNLKFKIASKDMNSVELALNRGQGPNNLFVLFEISDKWASGNFGMVLKNMSEKSSWKSSNNKKGDISRFEKSNTGKKVDTYSFDQTIVKDDKGVSYMQFVYVGEPMPLIESLTINNSIKLPRNISARFVNKQDITLLPGSYGIDSKIAGFWIPIEIN